MGRIALTIVVTLAITLIQACGGGDGGGADISPFVIATDPPVHSRGVRLSRPISATFSKDIHPLSIRSDTFFVDSTTGTVSYDREHRNAIFKPDINLVPNKHYVAHITQGVFDIQGHHMRAGVTWDFTTGDTAAITPLLL